MSEAPELYGDVGEDVPEEGDGEEKRGDKGWPLPHPGA